MRRKLKELEPLRAVHDIAPLTDRIEGTFVQSRLRTTLLVLFAATALALACVGLYGTLSYAVSLRRREIGLRLALGAMRRRVVREFVVQALRVVAVSAACGIGLALAFSRLLSGMLFGISATDPATLGGVVAIVTTVALPILASYSLARHAPRKPKRLVERLPELRAALAGEIRAARS